MLKQVYLPRTIPPPSPPLLCGSPGRGLPLRFSRRDRQRHAAQCIAWWAGGAWSRGNASPGLDRMPLPGRRVVRGAVGLAASVEGSTGLECTVEALGAIRRAARKGSVRDATYRAMQLRPRNSMAVFCGVQSGCIGKVGFGRCPVPEARRIAPAGHVADRENYSAVSTGLRPPHPAATCAKLPASSPH